MLLFRALLPLTPSSLWNFFVKEALQFLLNKCPSCNQLPIFRQAHLKLLLASLACFKSYFYQSATSTCNKVYGLYA